MTHTHDPHDPHDAVQAGAGAGPVRHLPKQSSFFFGARRYVLLQPVERNLFRMCLVSVRKVRESLESVTGWGLSGSNRV